MKMRYPKDLTGERFGKLTAISLNESKRYGGDEWHCVCDCGNEKDVARVSLVTGNTMSCGCVDTKFKKKDLQNTTIGKLLVLYELPRNDNSKEIRWRCRCVCGNEIDYTSGTLRKAMRGITQKPLTCGKCSAYIPVVKHGHLTPILGQLEKRNGKTYAPYKCDCGNTCMAILKDVNYGTVTSCGCGKSHMARLDDLTGRRYGHLTVKYLMPHEVASVRKWMCECDCGGTRIVSTGNLNAGHTTHCGCLSRAEDIVGKKFGRWTVLKKCESRKNGITYYSCICDCGTIKDVTGSSLKTGASTSCGCYHSEIRQNDITGMTQGMLKVLEKTNQKHSDGSLLWRCQCECGNITLVTSSDFLSGNVKSCGCLVSLGETLIEKLLRDNKIPYKKQKTFDDCKFSDSNRSALFDFEVDHRYLIEFDGEQHFKSAHDNGKVDRRWQNYEYIHSHDMFKTEYCRSRKIPLIRIPFTRLSKLCIDDLLIEKTQFRVA